MPQCHSMVCDVQSQAACSSAGRAASSQSASKFTINLYTCVPARQLPFSNRRQLIPHRMSRLLVCETPGKSCQIRKEWYACASCKACTSSSYRRTPPTPSGPCINITQFIRGVQHSRHAPCDRQSVFQLRSSDCVSYLSVLPALWRGRLGPDTAHLRWIRVPVSELTLYPSEMFTSQYASGLDMQSDHARDS